MRWHHPAGSQLFLSRCLRLRQGGPLRRAREHRTHLWACRIRSASISPLQHQLQVHGTARVRETVTRAHAGARVAALFATFEAGVYGLDELQAERAHAHLSRRLSCSCSGLLASAWLKALPGFTGLAAIRFCISGGGGGGGQSRSHRRVPQMSAARVCKYRLFTFTFTRQPSGRASPLGS